MTRLESSKISFKGFGNFEFENLQDSSRDSVELLLQTFKSQGAVWITDLPWDLKNYETAKRQLLSFCMNFGTPIPHNSSADSLVWDIKNNVNSNSTVVTHSERNSEAELHTDSAFSEVPENIFCLLALRKAACGGGSSLLLSSQQLLQEFRKHPNHERYEHLLRTKDYPFLIPTIFRKKKDSNFEYNAGPILKGNKIRYRGDMINKCFEFAPHLFDAEMIEALSFLSKVLTSCNSTDELMLEDGDLLLINNESMLHGRTAFSDTSRHLLRVRLSATD